MSQVRIDRSTVVRLMVWVGWTKEVAERWENERMAKFVGQLDRNGWPDQDPDEDLIPVLEAIENHIQLGDDFIVFDDSESNSEASSGTQESNDDGEVEGTGLETQVLENNLKEPEATAQGNTEAEGNNSNEPEQIELDLDAALLAAGMPLESNAKPSKKRQPKEPKAPKEKKQRGPRKPRENSLYAAIVSILQDGSEENPLCKTYILDKLCEVFPDRNRDSLVMSLNAHLPGKVSKQYNVMSVQMENPVKTPTSREKVKGYWIEAKEPVLT